MEIIMEMLEAMPWYGDMLLIMGTLRAIFKPIFSIASTVVAATPSTSDDKFLEDLRASRTYSLFIWALDFFASVKLPK